MIDIGANLGHSSFSHDLSDVLDRAKTNGINEIIVTGTDVAASQNASRLARQHPKRLFATAGVHPHDASSYNTDASRAIRELATFDEVVAIGETGLDFNRNFSSVDQQVSAFEQQLQIAAELNMPVFIHERDASDKMITMLKEYQSSIDKMVIHCFTGDAKTLQAYLELDLYIGITGWICDERRGKHLHDLVRDIPVGRLMLETDAPYLMPRNYPAKKQLHSSRRNEPCTLAHTASVLAQCRGETLAELIEHSRDTTIQFFGLAPLL